MTYQLVISHKGKIQFPPVADGVNIEWERQGQPGKMTFSIVKTDDVEFDEGDPVKFSVDGKALFYGYIFERSRKGSAKNVISVTVYDQLYYLKNKDTYNYKNKTASQLITMIAQDFNLSLGVIMPTKYLIKKRIEDNKSLFDIIQNALDLELKSTTTLYTLYDDAGKLTLKPSSAMMMSLLLDEDTAGEYDYKTSITESYDKIKLVKGDTEKGQQKTYISQDVINIAKWGVLQYYEKIDDDVASPELMAKALLELYNKKARTLSVNNVLGDVNIRAGSLIAVQLGLGDINVSNFLLVNSVKHSFKDNQHLMDLRLIGGDNFVA